MDIGTALASIGAAIDTVKFLRDVDRKLDEAELKNRLAEVYGGLADARMALADAREELRARDHEIAQLKQSFQRRDETVEHQGMRYRKGEDGKPDGRPFCPRCGDEGIISLTQASVDDPDHTSFCPRCGTNYRTKVFGD